MELLRFNREFSLPEGVALSVIADKVVMQGVAPYFWLRENQARLINLASDSRLDISRLTPSEQSVRAIIAANYESAQIKSLTSSRAEVRPYNGIVEVKVDVDATEFASLVSSFSGDSWVTLQADLK